MVCIQHALQRHQLLGRRRGLLAKIFLNGFGPFYATGLHQMTMSTGIGHVEPIRRQSALKIGGPDANSLVTAVARELNDEVPLSQPARTCQQARQIISATF